MTDKELKALFEGAMDYNKQTAIKESAKLLYEGYTAFKGVGFTDEQAMQLLCTIVEVTLDGMD